MEDWMHYDRMLPEVFQQLCAYPFPFGSANMQWVADASDDTLRRLSYPRLRDQAVSIFGVFEECKGEYCAGMRLRRDSEQIENSRKREAADSPE
jgi:hypothetical protein